MKHALIAFLLLAPGLAFSAEPAKGKSEDKKATETKTETKGKTMFATMETSMGKIKLQLFPDKAPKTVENFAGLADGSKEWTDPKTGEKKKKTPAYNGTVFHRVIKKFMIQGGDPLGNGTGSAVEKFGDEFSPDLKHSKPGILSMANSGPNTNGSQFFITVEPTPWLDNKHTIFGEVADKESLEVVKKISETKTENDKPVTPVVIKSIKIERK